MEIQAKILRALKEKYRIEHEELSDDNGVTGLVVSPDFRGLSSRERQEGIVNALRTASQPLDPSELRRVSMITAITPSESRFVGIQAATPVQSIQDLGDGRFELVVAGGLSDAEYVRGALKCHKGIQVAEAICQPDSGGQSWSVVVSGKNRDRLVKPRLIRILADDPYIALSGEASAMPSPVVKNGRGSRV